MESIKFYISSLLTIDQKKWEALYLSSSSKNVYYQYDYIKAVEELPANFHPDHIITGLINDELVLVQPVRMTDTIVGSSLEFFKPFWSDHVEPLCASGGQKKYINALLDFITTEIRPDLIFGRALSEAFIAILKETRKEEMLHISNRAVVPFMVLPENMDQFWALFKSNFRSSLRRRLRVAEREGLEIRILEPGNIPPGYSFPKALDNLRVFYEVRWGDRPKGRLDFCQPEIQHFHARFCESATGALAPLFVEILHEGKVIGSSYGLKAPRAFVLFQHGFDPKYRSFGMGDLLAYTSIKYAIKQGLSVLDFKQGDEQFKFKWTDQYKTNAHVHLPLTIKGRILLRQKLLIEQLHLDKGLKNALVKVKNKVLNS